MCVVDCGGDGAAFGRDGGAAVAIINIVLQTHVVAQLVGKTIVAGRAITVDDVERLTRKAWRFIRHQIREPTADRVVSPQAHHVGPVQIAQSVYVIHEAVAGALQTREVGREINFGIVDLARVDETHTLRHTAIGVGEVGLGDTQIDERIHCRGAALRYARSRRIHHHHIHRGAVVGSGIHDGEWRRAVFAAKRLAWQLRLRTECRGSRRCGVIKRKRTRIDLLHHVARNAHVSDLIFLVKHIDVA